jgi:type II secretory pathway pseudopilin PulG
MKLRQERNPDRKLAGKSLVEIMIVVAIITLLAAIAVPEFLRARKRSQATRILNDLRLIEGAVSVYAIEKSKAANTPLVFSDSAGSARRYKSHAGVATALCRRVLLYRRPDSLLRARALRRRPERGDYSIFVERVSL